MGLFGDIKGDINQAIEARDTILPESVQRIDTVVVDPVSGEQRRRTDYAGTVWYGGRPQMGRVTVGATIEITTPFWLPDSHMYEPGAVDDAQIQASAAVQSVWVSSSGGESQIFDVGAALGEDPQQGGALRVYLGVTASASLPLGVSYRVTVTCAPGAVRPPAVQ